MKIKIVFAWIFALLMLGPVVTASHSGDGPRWTSGTFSIIKGQIFDREHNGTWDFLSFGVFADKGLNVRVKRIVITDLSGEVVLAEINDFFSARDRTVNWYFVSLSLYDLPPEFLTRIYITSNREGGSTLLRQIQADGGGRAPIDPDETVVVVRWP